MFPPKSHLAPRIDIRQHRPTTSFIFTTDNARSARKPTASSISVDSNPTVHLKPSTSVVSSAKDSIYRTSAILKTTEPSFQLTHFVTAASSATKDSAKMTSSAPTATTTTMPTTRAHVPGTKTCLTTSALSARVSTLFTATKI